MNERDERLVREALNAERRDKFGAGFADRATARWLASRPTAVTLESVVVRQFRWLVPFAIAATAVLAVQNIRHRTTGQSVIDALIGARPATAQQEAAVTIESIYGLGVTPSIQE